MKSIVYGDGFVGVSDAIYITLVSVGIVFSVLLLICLFVFCMKFIPQEKKEIKAENKNTAKKAVAAVTTATATPTKETRVEPIRYEDENVRLAIMVASMEAAQENENAWIKIRSVKEIV